jgi:Na+-translocating ferredoxin:NAD+ oxidoreductase RNF subunit RnfB
MGFIDEYDSTDFSIHDDDELYIDFENVLPQITCPACGEKIDLDYTKCPFCKHEI